MELVDTLSPFLPGDYSSPPHLHLSPQGGRGKRGGKFRPVMELGVGFY